MKAKRFLKQLFILVFSMFVLCGTASTVDYQTLIVPPYDINEGIVTINHNPVIPSGATFEFRVMEDIYCGAIPSEGYAFKQWHVVPEDALSDRFNPFAQENLFDIDVEQQRSVSLSAEFEPISKVTISVSTNPSGSIDQHYADIFIGQSVDISATETAGYQFKEWKLVSGRGEFDNEYNTNTKFTVRGTDDVLIEAVFEEITVTGISLNSDDAKKEYTVGDELDLNNLILTVTKSDGTTETVNVTEDMISGFDSSKAGKQTVTVTYAGFTDSYEVEVKEKEVNPTPTPSPTNPSDSTSKTSYNSGYGTSASPNSAYESSGKSGVISVPDTSDHRDLTIWILLMVASLGGLVISSSWWGKRKFSRR